MALAQVSREWNLSRRVREHRVHLSKCSTAQTGQKSNIFYSSGHGVKHWKSLSAG